MSKLSDIRRQIKPALQKLERERKEQLTNLWKERLWYLIPISFIAFEVLGTIYYWDTSILPIHGFIAALISALYIGIIRVGNVKSVYKSSFKKEVLSSFVQLSYSNVYYAPANYVPASLYAKSKLCEDFDYYTGEDYFEGKTENGCAFKFSELSISREVTGDEIGETTTQWLFSGLFFVIDVPKRVNGRIVILPDYAESMLGFVGKYLQKTIGNFFHNEKVVYLKEHPEFEKEFVVRSKDEAEVYRVLTPELLQAIYELRYKWNIRMSISFVDHQIYVAIPCQKNFFEHNIKKPLLDNKLIEELYDELALCFAVVENLSKEHQPSESWDALHVTQNEKNGTKNKNPFLL